MLSNPQKRKIYDEYGEMGLKLLEQFGDDDTIMTLAFKPWFKVNIVDSFVDTELFLHSVGVYLHDTLRIC